MKMPKTISKEDFEKWMKGLKSEIIANCVLIPKCDADEAWNQAKGNDAKLVEEYSKGKGLFQL